MNLAQTYFCFEVVLISTYIFKASTKNWGFFFFIFLFFRSTDPSNFEKNPCSQKLNWSGLTRLSYFAAWPSLEPRPLQVFILFFFCPTDQPTITRDRAIGNETFYWDGLTINHIEHDHFSALILKFLMRY